MGEIVVGNWFVNEYNNRHIGHTCPNKKPKDKKTNMLWELDWFSGSCPYCGENAPAILLLKCKLDI